MLDLLVAGSGCALIALVVLDVFWTVLWSSNGAGPLTGTITNLVRRLTHPLADRSRRLLSTAGPAALLLIVLAWSGLLLVGFTLALQFDPDAITAATTGRPADIGERAYYVGYTLFTLGTGEYVPATDATRAASVLANSLGMFLLTLSVTYLLPVISASVQSRSFGSSALSLGRSPEEAVTGAWDGERIRLDLQLLTLSSELSTLAHQHLAYPVLHLFHSQQHGSSAPLAAAMIDDVLTLLDAVDPAVAPPAPSRRQLRSSIELYATTFGDHVRGASPGAPPALAPLTAAGIPVVCDDDAFARLLAGMRSHRGRMQGLIDATGAAG